MISRGSGGGWMKSKDEKIIGFTCRCDKCGSEDVELVDSIMTGSDWTGQYGSIDLRCKQCGNVAELYH